MVCFRRPPPYLNVNSDLDEGRNAPDTEEGRGWIAKFTKIGNVVDLQLF